MVLRFRSCPRRRLALLTLLCGAFATSLSAADPGFLSPDTPSAILIDEEAISEQICPPQEETPVNPAKKGTGHTAKCRVVLKNGETPRTDEFELLDPVKTACGPWHADVELETPHVRQDFPLAWTADPEDPGHGLFAGAFEMMAHLHLTHSETGETAEVALPVRFNLAGPWALASSGDFAVLMEGDEVTFEKCIPQDFADKYQFEVVEGECQLCVLSFAVQSFDSSSPHQTPPGVVVF